MKPEFIEFETKDGLTLPGLFYESKKAKAAAIYIHANGSASVFYNEKRNHDLVLALEKCGISSLYFNNRGAHIIKWLKVRKKEKVETQIFGTGYEKIKDCVHDIDAAIAFLKARGYKTFYLIGLSTGANKICVYNFYRPNNEVSKYVLLSGGDDTASYYKMMGKKKFWKTLALAKEMTKNKKGDEIVKENLSPMIFAYKGFADIADPDGDYNTFPFYESLGGDRLSKKPLLRYFKKIKKPSLVVYAENDQYLLNPAKDVVGVLKLAQPTFDYKIIAGADHSFREHQSELSKVVSLWLSSGK